LNQDSQLKSKSPITALLRHDATACGFKRRPAAAKHCGRRAIPETRLPLRAAVSRDLSNPPVAARLRPSADDAHGDRNKLA
jgi:hypothetical protein